MIDPPPTTELLDFSGRTVIVTGGGSGLGSGICRRFAAAGAAVVVGYRTSDDGAGDVVDAIGAAGGRAAAVQADLTDEGDVERLFDATARAFGRADVLINNAGGYPLAALVDMSVEEWQTTLDVNLKSVFLTTRAFARRMPESERSGAIVNIASIEAVNPAPSHSHYNAAKAGVVMYTRAAASELGPSGVRVNSVSPGLIWRPGLDEAWPEGVDRYRAAAPLGRLGRDLDVADACLFLASEGARWITGADLRVDGGVMTQQVY